MIDKNWVLSKLDTGNLDYKAYFRPFIFKSGKVKNNNNVILAGINPATPIYPKDISKDDYCDLLFNFDKFYEKYQKIRLIQGKTKISRTRLGINNFVNYLQNKYNINIYETNIIPYPTENIKRLKELDQDFKNKSFSIFKELVNMIKPLFIILHSKFSINYLSNINEIKINCYNKKIKINQLQDKEDLSIMFDNSKIYKLFICNHFMYYGKSGNSYIKFKNIIDNEISMILPQPASNLG